MIHLEKLGFLLLIAIGALMYAAVRGNPHLRQARTWAQSKLWSFVALLCLCVVMVAGIVVVAVLASIDVNFTERPLIRELNTPIFVKIPLALLCGALFVELAAVVKKAEFTPLYLAVRAVPFVFFFTIGFFSYELQQSFQFLTRIEAAGVTLDFNAASPQETQSLLQDPSVGGSSDARTAFQLGISLLPEAFDPVTTDHQRVTRWCNAFDALNCGSLRRIRVELEKVEAALAAAGGGTDAAALKAQRNELQAAAVKAKRADERLGELFETTGRYMELLKPLQQCLEGVYVGYFPNGSPIQDELSEFAAIASIDYESAPEGPLIAGTAWPDADKIADRGPVNEAQADDLVYPAVGDPAESTNEGLRYQLRVLREKLVRFGDYVQQYSDPTTRNFVLKQGVDADSSTSNCQSLRTTLNDDRISELIDVRYRLTRLSLLTPGDQYDFTSGASGSETGELTVQLDLPRKYSLPYESIFEAAIVAASGYPEEAARHLVREYRRLTLSLDQEHFGIAKNDFAEFLLQVRILSPLEAIFAYSRNRAEQVRYAETLVDRVEVQLQKLKPFPDGKRSGFVAHCADASLIPGDGGDRVLRDEVEDYFRRLTHFYLRSYARLLEAVAFDPGVFTQPERFNKFARVAEDLGELASHDSTALDGCIGKTYRDAGVDQATVGRIIELLRFDLLAAHGFVLARAADQREIDPEIAPHIDRSYKQDATCKAQRVLLDAWRIRHVSAPQGSQKADTAYSEKIYKIRRILEQINRAGVDCLA